MKLYLDDVRKPLDTGWKLVTNYHDFVSFITLNGLPDFISFDHDINSYDEEGNELTGLDCAKWLINNNYVVRYFSVHSANPIGAENILYLLNNWQKHNGIKPNGYKTFWECKIELDEL
jgi:hypothetical protein